MSPPSRRVFLRDAGLIGTAAALPWLAGCGDDSAGGAAPFGSADVAASFEHGVASGDPLADRVILWTRATPAADGPVPVDWAVGMDPEMQQVMYSGTVVTDAERDYTVKLDATGLAPGTTYYYRFHAGGTLSPVGRTRTAPAGETQRLRLAVTSCAKYHQGFFNAYGRLAERRDLDAVLNLGDYIYEEHSKGGAIPGRDLVPDIETLTLAEYRTRYAFWREDPDLQECHRQHPFICTWDDHELANDCWMDGAENHNPNEGTWEARKQAAARAYHEWMPIRTPDASDLTRIFRAFEFGDLVQLIMPETRVFGRSRPADSMLALQTLNDPARSMLGFEQENWLASQLQQSSAQWRVMGSATMFAQLHVLNSILNNDVINVQLLDIPGNPDQWDGYDPNRQRLFDTLKARQIDNFVVVSGDIHTSWACELSPSPGDPTQYNPVTGCGSLGVEFVGPSVTSNGEDDLDGVADAIRLVNTHIKYIDLLNHGYVLLDITPERCQGEYWFIDTRSERTDNEFFGKAYATANGTNHLVEQSQPSEPDAEPPALAPAAAGAESV